MSDATRPVSDRELQQDLAERLASRRSEIFWIGVAMVVVGVLAILFPFLATLTLEVMIGSLLVLAGLVGLVSSFSVQGTGPFFGTLLLSLLNLGVGIYCITHPAVGIVVLTIVLAVLFLVEGAVQLAFSFDMRNRSGWGWMLLSGLVSIAVGLFIAAGLPGTSLFALGLLVGISFLSTGLAFIIISQQSVPAEATRTASTQAGRTQR